MSLANPLGNPLGNPLVLNRCGGGGVPRDPVIVDFLSNPAGNSFQLSGVFQIPAWANFYRVTVVGGGGSGVPGTSSGSGGGGGGGGLARSAIVPAYLGRSIAWTAGTPSAGTLDGGDSFAVFGNVSLLATGGKTAITTGGLGGVGSGGVDNWSGGKGGDNGGPSGGSDAGAGGGGGAAGLDSNGGDGGSGRRNGFSSTGNGGGGGGGASSTTAALFSGGGGGVGADGAPGFLARPSTLYVEGASLNPFFGRPGVLFTGEGGLWGGGGGASGTVKGWGGRGGVRIELW